MVKPHICNFPECRQEFTSKKALYSHYKEYHSKLVLECVECIAAVADILNQRHQREHLPKKPNNHSSFVIFEPSNDEDTLVELIPVPPATNEVTVVDTEDALVEKVIAREFSRDNFEELQLYLSTYYPETEERALKLIEKVEIGSLKEARSAQYYLRYDYGVIFKRVAHKVICPVCAKFFKKSHLDEHVKTHEPKKETRGRKRKKKDPVPSTSVDQTTECIILRISPTNHGELHHVEEDLIDFGTEEEVLEEIKIVEG